jgi:tRNA (mo5U34)-methyltransferase
MVQLHLFHLQKVTMERILSHIDRLRLFFIRDELVSCMEDLRHTMAANQGNISKWRNAVENLPAVSPSECDFTDDRIRIGTASDITYFTKQDLLSGLKSLMPWRKGPFELFGIPIDTEWASNIKWNRLKDAISPLKGRRVLDVGCSSGYYMFRMLEHRPEMVLGIDPQWLYYHQFLAVTRYIVDHPLYFLPVKLESLPLFEGYFDTVFCMGVIYHRKSPVETLQQIRQNMRKNGELILETLIIENDSPVAFFPADRYASMRNVFFIPSVPCLESWLARSGFGHPVCVDISKTTTDEQRITDWTGPVSLENFLDPEDPSRTIEGYPAPVRAVVIAKAV